MSLDVQVSNSRPIPRGAKVKTLTASFFTIEPRQGSKQPFKRGEFPVEAMLQRVGEHDSSQPEYRLTESLFGNEQFCLVNDDGPLPLICSYTKDMFAAPETEQKGHVRRVLLDEGEGIVDAAYFAVFPNDIVGMVRASSKAPGAATTATWLSQYGGVPFHLSPLPNPAAIRRLTDGSLVRRFRFGVRSAAMKYLPPADHGLAAQLQALAQHVDEADVVIVETRSNRRKAMAPYSSSAIQQIMDLIEFLPEIQEAKVWLAGQKNPIDLRGAMFKSEANVYVERDKRVTPRAAAEALVEAYDQERDAIVAALEYASQLNRR